MVVGVYTAIVVVCAHAQDLSCLPLGFYIDIVWRNKLSTIICLYSSEIMLPQSITITVFMLMCSHSVVSHCVKI